MCTVTLILCIAFYIVDLARDLHVGLPVVPYKAWRMPGHITLFWFCLLMSHSIDSQRKLLCDFSQDGSLNWPCELKFLSHQPCTNFRFHARYEYRRTGTPVTIPPLCNVLSPPLDSILICSVSFICLGAIRKSLLPTDRFVQSEKFFTLTPADRSCWCTSLKSRSGSLRPHHAVCWNNSIPDPVAS